MQSIGANIFMIKWSWITKYRIVALSDESKKDLVSELLKGAKISTVGSEADLPSIL